MPSIQSEREQVRSLGRIFVVYLWLSAFWCFLVALITAQMGEGEDAKLLSAALFAFGMTAIAFARAFRDLHQPRWWHWVLGAVLVTPAILYVIDLTWK